MTLIEWVFVGLVVCWLGVLAASGYLYVLAYRALADDEQPAETEPVLFAAEYMAGLDRLRAAIAEADMETEPGAPSADLIDCWGIWPDAPLAKDGRR